MTASLIALPETLPNLNGLIFRASQANIPLLEDPLYSNRAPWLDALCRKWGIPLGSYWCALLPTEIWSSVGAEVPPIDPKRGWHPAIVQTWYEWSLETGRFSHEPQLGCATLYGRGGHAPCDHMGVSVMSLRPLLTDMQGNTSVRPGDRNGELSLIKPVDLDRIVGYIHPLPVPV